MKGIVMLKGGAGGIMKFAQWNESIPATGTCGCDSRWFHGSKKYRDYIL